MDEVFVLHIAPFDHGPRPTAQCLLWPAFTIGFAPFLQLVLG
jgi:hypothetical protein